MITEPNFSAYFNRIGYAGPREPSLAVLRELCACQPRHIPSNVSILFLGLASTSIFRRYRRMSFTRGEAGIAMSKTDCFTMCWPPWGSQSRRSQHGLFTDLKDSQDP